MALNTSGAISLAGSTTGQSIAIELGQSATGTIALNDTVVRDLAGIASGAITMPGDFWGKSSTIVGPLYYIGDNGYGSAGNNNTTPYTTSPVLAAGGRTDWVRVANGGIKTDGGHVLAIDDTGRLWSWGNNDYGQLGLNSTVRKLSPVQIGSATNWESVSTGCWTTGRAMGAAVNSSGGAWVWGDNYFQQITNWNRSATGVRNPCSSPVQLGTGNIYQTFNTLITSVSRIMIANGKNCYVLKNNGVMYAAGQNYFGACGINYSYNDVAYEPVQGGITDWVEASCSSSGNSNSYFVRQASGLLYACGIGQFGANGNNNTALTLSSPVNIGGGYKTVRGTEYGGIGIRTNGQLYAWGRNSKGMCGQNNTVAYSNPVQIGSLTTWDRFLEDATNEDAIAMFKTDGTLWALGYARQIDQVSGGNVYYSSPVQIMSTFTSSYTISHASSSGSQGTIFLVD